MDQDKGYFHKVLIHMFHQFIHFFSAFFSLFYQHTTLVIGDSEVAYTHPHFSAVQESNETIVKEFKGGTVIQQWFGDRLDTALNKHPNAETIIIFLGTNNAGRKDDLDITPILSKIKDKKCIWVGPVAVNGQRWNFNKLLQANVLKNSNCKYVNSEELGLKLLDGYHPDQESAIRWLKEVWAIKSEM